MKVRMDKMDSKVIETFQNDTVSFLSGHGFEGYLEILDNNLIGNCPFYRDTRPTLFVDWDRSSWHCDDGCQGSDVTTLLEEVSNFKKRKLHVL